MQYGHCVVSAMAMAISSLYFFGMAPSARAALSRALNPANASGARCPRAGIRARSDMLNMKHSFRLVGRYFGQKYIRSMRQSLEQAGQRLIERCGLLER